MRRGLLGIASALALATSPPAQAGTCADVALVLAVDASDSVDDQEYAFQKDAISAAFRDKAVIAAMRDAGTVALSAVFWGDVALPVQSLGWVLVHEGEGAEPFVAGLQSNRRAVFGNTDMGNGIWSALRLLSDTTLCARKSIVDLSGDGRETLGPKRRHVISLHRARVRASQMDVTINALVISDDDRSLAGYYAKQVILGPDAFVMAIGSYADYSAAIKRKLIKELADRAPGSGILAAAD